MDQNNPLPTPEDGRAGFTPGPWRWQRFGREWKLVGAHSDVPIILDAQSSATKASQIRVRNEARCLMVPLTPEHPDALLIKASPMLYEACAAIEGAMRLGYIGSTRPASDPYSIPGPDYFNEHLARIRAALSAARGDKEKP